MSMLETQRPQQPIICQATVVAENDANKEFEMKLQQKLNLFCFNENSKFEIDFISTGF